MSDASSPVEEQFMFEAKLDLEEDLVAELENFILHARLKVTDEAMQIVDKVLWRHLHHFPVFAEVAGFLIELGDTTGAMKMLLALDETTMFHWVFDWDHARTIFRLIVQKYASGMLGDLTISSLEMQARMRYSTAVSDNDCSRNEAGLSAKCDRAILALLAAPKYSSPVEVQALEVCLASTILSRKDSKNALTLVRAYAEEHFERLLSNGLIWEAAQIFSIICRSIWDLQDSLNGTSSEIRRGKSIARKLYGNIIKTLDIQGDMADIASHGQNIQLEKLLTALSATTTILEFSERVPDFLTPTRYSVLHLEVSVLVQTAFQHLENPMPRGYYARIVTKSQKPELESIISDTEDSKPNLTGARSSRTLTTRPKERKRGNEPISRRRFDKKSPLPITSDGSQLPHYTRSTAKKSILNDPSAQWSSPPLLLSPSPPLLPSPLLLPSPSLLPSPRLPDHADVVRATIPKLEFSDVEDIETDDFTLLGISTITFRHER